MVTVLPVVERKKYNKFVKILESKSIYSVFQAIISLNDGSILGYEALSRGPAGTDFENPTALFDIATKYGKLFELEMLCRSNALGAFSEMGMTGKLFLNVYPSIIQVPEYRKGFTREHLNEYKVIPQSIVFEITEKEAIRNRNDFISAVENYKSQDYEIAIDDAGAGYSGLNLISDIHPHYLKLDMNLVRDINKNSTKQSLVKSMVEFAGLTNTYIIAEGIETQSEFEKLVELGVDFGQGFFIQKPSQQICNFSDTIIKLIKVINDKKENDCLKRASSISIKDIARAELTLSPDITVMEVENIMKNNPDITECCILKDDEVIGVISKSKLYRHISGMYGYSLYNNKSISTIMSKIFLCVDAKMSIEEVSKNAMSRSIENLYDFITVVNNGKYLGNVTIKDLLEKSFEIAVKNATHLNPLSELPGNTIIESQLEKCIHSEFHKSILYFDIDNFKSFNDVYGFENGDRVLRHITKILKNRIPESEFLGHVGGDDFVAILETDIALYVSNLILEDFDRSISQFYNEKDKSNGYIISKDRFGGFKNFPLMTLSIAGINTSSVNFRSIFELSEEIASIKTRCKALSGSNVLIAS